MTTRFGFVALVGRPNAGKSTLLNRVLGQKLSIVSDKPQTTRHQILGVLTEENCQIAFMDLPGFHKPMYEMNKVMMQNVYDGMDGCDVILYMIDASEPIGSGERYLMEQLTSRKDRVIVALNKVDAIKKSRVLPIIEELNGAGFGEIVPISAERGDNVEELIALIRERMPEGPFQFDEDAYTNITERFFVAEVIREKLLQETRDEIPYTSFVEIRSMEITDDEVDILCDIVVERPSQKPIVIGRQGRKIGTIRRSALKELKAYFDRPVHLELFVRVERNWRQKQRFMNQFRIM